MNNLTISIRNTGISYGTNGKVHLTYIRRNSDTPLTSEVKLNNG